MRKIDKVVYQDIIPPSCIALIVLTFVAFTNEFGRLAELLIKKNIESQTVLLVVVSILPGILIFTLPFAFLIGTLVGFSRLSTDSEITAMRAAGISVFQILQPALRIGILVLAGTAVLTLWLLPLGNWTLRQLQYQIQTLPVQAQIKPRVFYEEFPGTVLYVEDIELQTSAWKGVLVVDTSEEGEKRTILARRGHAVAADQGRRIQLHFEDGSIYKTRFESPEADTLSRFATMDLPIQLPELQVSQASPKRPEEMTTQELMSTLQNSDPDLNREARIEIHRRLALPVAAILFAVLAVTLGIRTHKGGRGYGIVVSIALAFGYFILFATGAEMSSNQALPVIVGVWGANFLLSLGALLSLRMIGRETAPGHFLQFIRRREQVRSKEKKRGRKSAPRLKSMTARLADVISDLPRPKFRVARVIDLYIIRTFLPYFGLTLAVCSALFYLFTFFELLDDIYINQISYGILFDYFLYLLPHTLIMLVPISHLMGTLITFGTLEKTNQLMALKACGLSLYRVSLPTILLAVLFSSSVFVMQDYVLPYANQRQDNLRNVIKGRPAQTSAPGRTWIFGEKNRLYNYNYFDPDRRLFAEFSIYEVELKESRVLKHTYAQRAVWNAEFQSWQLENGWIRSFQPAGYDYFERQELFLPEKPQYFSKEVQESSKMTYLELKEYIADLQKGGVEVDHLKTQLNKKLSFPVVNLIMVLLGIPFSFSVGRKGALYGIAAGVLIGIIYWGAFGVFDLLGANGLLSPLLAAWGPNLVFGAGSLLLLSGVRT